MNVSAIASLVSTAISAGKSAPKAAGKEEAAAQPSPSAVVSLSGAKPAEAMTYSGKLGLPELLLPTHANAAKLAAQAAEKINAKLDAAGIPREPGFDVVIEDVNSAHVTIKGGRADAKAIEDLINGDQSLQMDIHNAYAIASGIPAMERALAFDKEYRAAQTKAQIDAVIARYSDLFSGFTPAADVAMHFGKDGLQVAVNGETLQAA